MPVRALRGVVVLLLLLTACHRAQPVTPEQPKPTPQGPSQSAAEAKRDVVPADIARMTLDQRTELDVVDSPSITTDEGIWAVARPRANPPYGEVLLLDQRREHIIKAFPLPGAPPYYLAVTDSAVYCARSGDGALPDTTVCRIDRRSRTLSRRTYKSGTLDVYEFVANASGVWAKDFHSTWTKLDPNSLAIVARGAKAPSG